MIRTLMKITTIFVISGVLLASQMVYAITNEADGLKTTQDSNKNKIDEANEKINEIRVQKSVAQKEVDRLSNEIYSYQSEIDKLDAEIAELESKITKSEKEIVVQEKEHDERNDILDQRLISAYESGDTTYLDVLLSSKSIVELISNYYLVSELSENDTALLEEIEEEKISIENSKKQLEVDKKEIETSKANKENAAMKLQSSKNEKTTQIANLTESEKQANAQIEQLKADNDRISAEIIVAQKKYEAALEELRKKEKPNNNNSKNNGGNYVAPNSGYLQRPVSGGYVSATAYYSSGRFHGAIDYAVSPGTPIYAAASGVVMTTANLTKSYGTYIAIKHPNGLITYYGHGTLGSICVKPGQTVSKGQKIMLSGNTGNSTGPHLHFEVRKAPHTYNSHATGYGQDSRVNPANYM